MIFTLILVFIFLLGLFLGSFLLVVADRTSQGVSYIKGRSKCDGCGHVLSWYELVPVVSYLIQKGRCRHCRAKLGYKYPLAELLTGASVILIFFATISLGVYVFFLYLVITSCLLVILFSDIQYEIIPFPVVVLMSAAALILLGLLTPDMILSHIFAGIVAGAFFLLIFILTRGKGMGFGDVVFVLSMGLVLGIPGILYGLYISFITGALISLILVVLKKKRLRGGTIPFGPFLVLGTFIMMIWGGEISQLVLDYVR